MVDLSDLLPFAWAVRALRYIKIPNKIVLRLNIVCSLRVEGVRQRVCSIVCEELQRSDTMIDRLTSLNLSKSEWPSRDYSLRSRAFSSEHRSSGCGSGIRTHRKSFLPVTRLSWVSRLLRGWLRHRRIHELWFVVSTTTTPVYNYR